MGDGRTAVRHLRKGNHMNGTAFDYAVIVSGSGFGGSVSVLRAVEKGYRVGSLGKPCCMT